MSIGQLESLQVKPGDEHFRIGMFPSRRQHPLLPYSRWDSNIFYPALIDFTLSPLLGLMTEDERMRTRKVLEGVRANYPAYESQRQPGLYNFYRTNPPDPYPNGYLLHRFQHFRLAEDADDTVMISTNLPDLPEDRISFLRKELVRFSNLDGKLLNHPLPDYGGIPAHGVWFGTGAMPVEIDLCVLCNILYFTARKDQPFNPTDMASFAFIRRALETGDIFNHSFKLSYYYPDPTVMLYHVARLWSALANPERHLPKSSIVDAIGRRMAEVSGILPRIMLATSLLKIGEAAPVVEYAEADLVPSFERFSFFIAPMLAGTRSRLLNCLAQRRLFQVDYVCEAYYRTLVWEYELLRR